MVQMKKTAVLSTCLALAFSTQAFASDMEVNQYIVDVPQNFYVPYHGGNQMVFPKGFKTGFGSAMAIKSVHKDGSIEFYMLSDRGPNADGPLYQVDDKQYASKYFPSPDFQPQIGVGVFKDGKISIKKTIGLKNADGSKITGLPLSPGLIGATNEIALDDAERNMGYDNNGLDPEGIAVDNKGNIWICDEYGPFIAKFDKHGKMIKKYAPGNGLPDILKYRTPNRGFEGLTITPSGTVVAVEQSVLNVEGKTKKTAQFTRMVALDPVSGKTKTYAYPIDVKAYKSPANAKIGDVFAISDTEYLMIEQGEDKNNVMRNLVYKVDISNADDISNRTINKKALEYSADVSEIQLAKKELVVDLRACGWQAEKAEGIVLLPDNQTIAVVNDNDFGLALDIEDKENPKAKITDYVLKSDGTFMYQNKTASPAIKIGQNSEVEREMYLFTIKLPKPLK